MFTNRLTCDTVRGILTGRKEGKTDLADSTHEVTVVLGTVAVSDEDAQQSAEQGTRKEGRETRMQLTSVVVNYITKYPDEFGTRTSGRFVSWLLLKFGTLPVEVVGAAMPAIRAYAEENFRRLDGEAHADGSWSIVDGWLRKAFARAVEDGLISENPLLVSTGE